MYIPTFYLDIAPWVVAILVLVFIMIKISMNAAKRELACKNKLNASRSDVRDLEYTVLSNEAEELNWSEEVVDVPITVYKQMTVKVRN